VPVRQTIARLAHLRRTKTARVVGFAIGAALVVAAVAAAIGQDPQALQHSWQAIRSQPLLLVLAFIALPAANWLAISSSLWILLERFGRLRHNEMAALVAMAWLLNYLPMRPGLVGRVTYHKLVNGISVRHSGRTLVEASVITAAASVATLAAALALRASGSAAAWIAITLAPAGLGAAYALAVRARNPLHARYAAAFALRVVDIAVWGARYALAFHVIGSPIGVPGAMALAVASQVAMLVPLAGNGLGLREWLIGLLAASMPIAAAASPDIALGRGLTADVLNRAVEVLVAVPVGLIGSALVVRRLRRHRREQGIGHATGSPQAPAG